MNDSPAIIFSDLDGTLLDHYTYQFSAASETLACLKNADIPVVLNTSKTYAELKIILKQLDLNTPFIVENGAAIYIPVGTFSSQPADTVKVDEYWVKSFCLPRTYWLNLLEEGCTAYAEHFKGFSHLSNQQLAELTGLDESEATRAKQRQFGEPVHWLSDKATKHAFMHHLIDLGANVVQGGRFIHVGGFCDKGQALIWLAEQYRQDQGYESLTTIALGDGENDIAMLEAADIAVQVRSPVHEFPTLYRQFNTIQTDSYGPKGWAEALQVLLKTQLNSEVKHG